MASNKNQHYVPQCYLRRFSTPKTEKCTNLLNIDRKVFIKNAPIKKQCSKSYFYGEDLLLEKALQPFEGKYSEIVNCITKPSYQFTNDHKKFLKQFWLLQYSRTEAASKRSIELSEKFGSAIEHVINFKLELDEAVINSMRNFVEDMDAVDDLNICLVKNKTNIDFITSDDPAVITNRLFIQKKQLTGKSFGLGNSGIITFLPLTPKILALGYDADVYNIKDKNGWVSIKSKKDIESINQHQYLNCRANIFVQNPKSENYIKTAYKNVSHNRVEARHQINYSVFEKSYDGYEKFIVVSKEESKKHKRVLLHIENVHPIPKYWPKQIAWKINGYAYTNGSAVGYIRQSKIC